MSREFSAHRSDDQSRKRNDCSRLELVFGLIRVVRADCIPADAHDKLKAGKDALTAQVDAMKADLAHRIAFVKLMSIIGKE